MQPDDDGRMPVQFLDSNDGGVTDCPRCGGRIVIEFEDDGIYVKEGLGLTDLVNQFIDLFSGGSH